MLEASESGILLLNVFVSSLRHRTEQYRIECGEGLMSEELLFRIALVPTAFFIWARYVTWPLFIIGASVLIHFRSRPEEGAITNLLFVHKALVAVAVLLSISLVAAYFLIPETDRQAGVFW